MKRLGGETTRGEWFGGETSRIHHTRETGAYVNISNFLAMAASDFTLDRVKEFMLSHGGRVKNHELVTHFKAYLNDPDRKGAFQ